MPPWMSALAGNNRNLCRDRISRMPFPKTKKRRKKNAHMGEEWAMAEGKSTGLNRRLLLQTSLALGGLAGLGGCATTRARPGPNTAGLDIEDVPPKLAPIRAHPDRIFDIRVCIRPFRVLGPRLDTETVGDALIVHNYGHGGSGWSLSWGSANVAVQKAIASSPQRIAVIGCGIVGLSSAITAQRAGAEVTIYTRELLPRTRSVRANGIFQADSRICLGAEAPANFG